MSDTDETQIAAAPTRVQHVKESRAVIKALRRRLGDDEFLPEVDWGEADGAAAAIAREHFLAIRKATSSTLITAMEIGADLIAARMALSELADAEWDRIATAMTGYQQRRREEFVLLYERLQAFPEDSPLRSLPVDSVKLLVAPTVPEEAVTEVVRLIEIGETPTVQETRQIVREARMSADETPPASNGRSPSSPKDSEAMTPDVVRVRRMLRAVNRDLDKIEDVVGALD